MDKARLRWSLEMAVLVLLAAAAAQVIPGEMRRVASDHGLWDFGAFIASARAAAEGLDPYGVYPLTPHVVFPGFEAWNPNLNPPVSALLFRAFDIGEPENSFRVWFWISACCYAGTVALLLWRYARGVDAVLLTIWMFGLAGFWDTLYLGQIYVPLLLLAVGAWLLLEKRQDVAAGVLIGLVVAMKPNFLVWPVLLFLAGSYRPPIVAGATAAVVSLVPLIHFGPEVYHQWLTLVANDGDRAFFLTNASLSGFTARAGMNQAGLVLSIGLLLALAAWAFWKRPGIMKVSSAALVASVFASPLGWVHYTLFLLPMMLHHRTQPLTWAAAALLVIPVSAVLGYFGRPLIEQLTYGSVYGWAVLLCLIVVLFDVKDEGASASHAA
jgi:hypothetical protein